MSTAPTGTKDGREPIVVECHVPATPDRVFQAWTDPSVIMQWFGHAPNSLHSAQVDLRPGGAWRFLTSKDDEGSVGFEGEYLDVRRDERLVFTWARVVAHANGEREATLHAEIEVKLSAKNDGTDVRVTHTVKKPEDSLQGIGENWMRAFASLEALFTGSGSEQ